jgi:ABC-type antimicrobial peptide transport system permease subunit
VYEIVGVVQDLITDVSVVEPLAIYHPLSQQPPAAWATLVVSAATNAGAAAGDVLSTIRGLDPAIVPGQLLTLDEQITRQMGPQSFGAAILAALGTIAVLLTVLGTYVLAESMAAVRRRELGIRAALGATRRQLGGLVLSESARLVGLGLIAGLALSWALAGLIRSFLYQVEPLDPLTLAIAAGTILTLALAISLKPAVGAARVNVARLLREE